MNGIKLWGGYMITADSNQFILGMPVTRATKRDGVPVEQELMDNAKYYPTLGSALHGAYKMFLREHIQTGVFSLKEALIEAQEIEQRLMDIGEANGLRNLTKE